MPESHPENKEWSFRLIADLSPKSVLDVGPGSGIYALMCRSFDSNIEIDAVEVWTPYISEYKLEELYDRVFNQDARSFDNFRYDLVILGDVMEHMSKNDAVRIWKKVASQATYALLSIPTIYYPQAESHGNPFEEHVTDNWSVDSVLETFPGITYYRQFEVTSVFFASFR
jgi:hypothetical protein